ncbi:MAG: NADH-quinone oxidoreductase subunit N [Dehalococcoidia bacterium]|nr:NADH-quinone oxidoreductase subunit N [Dehalococcoidia bacterium]
MENLTANIHLLWPEALVAVLALVVLTADFFLPAERKNALAAVAVVGLVGLIVFTLVFLAGKGATPLYGGIVMVDRFGLFFKVAFMALGVLVILASVDFVKRYLAHPGEYYAMVLFSVLGMMLMVAATELLTAYIGLELLSFSLYILVSHSQGDPKSNEAGTKYILLGAFASALLLYGISMVYGAVVQDGIAAPTTFQAISTHLQGRATMQPMFMVGLVFIIAGLGFKVAAVPFHMWTPDVYEGAPLPITAYLAVGSKAAAFALVLRLFATAFLPAIHEWQMVVAILAAATMTLGNLVALAQHNIKRLLAYSSIGQVGYLLVGLAALGLVGSNGDVTISPGASNAIILHLVGYGIANLAAFVAIIAFYNATGKDEVSDFAGLADRNPFIAMALTVSLFSLAGLPIFAGFITKFYLFTVAAQADMLWLAGLAMVNSLISVYYYLVVIRQMYIQPAKETTHVPLTWVTGGLLGMLVLGTVLIGVYPGPLVKVIQTATAVILPGA